MVILSNSDMYEVRLATLLADYDRETLTNLYQPIIGYQSLAVYFTLWTEASNQKVNSLGTHEELLLRMKIATGEFIEARKVLEAVGLVKTRLEKSRGFSIYHYELHAPKTPAGFFNDTLLYGLFIQNLGETNALKIKRVYETDKMNNLGEDVTASFGDIFHPDFEDAAFMQASKKSNNTLGRVKGKIDTEFSFEKFFSHLSEVSQINENSITKKELKEIERLASLYGIGEEIAASSVAKVYLPEGSKGKRVDLEALNEDFKNTLSYKSYSRTRSNKKNFVLGESGLAAKIKLFEMKSPAEVLSYLRNNTKPAKADLNVIYSLSTNYNLPNAVINVIVDYVLSTNDNILSSYKAEQIAASFAGQNIETAVDAMEFLKTKFYKKNGTRKKEFIKDEPKEEEVEEAKKANEEKDDDVLDFFKDW